LQEAGIGIRFDGDLYRETTWQSVDQAFLSVGGWFSHVLRIDGCSISVQRRSHFRTSSKDGAL
jgi:hypothetical protein